MILLTKLLALASRIGLALFFALQQVFDEDFLQRFFLAFPPYELGPQVTVAPFF